MNASATRSSIHGTIQRNGTYPAPYIGSAPVERRASETQRATLHFWCNTMVIQDISDKLVKDQNTGGVSSPMVTKGPQNKLPDSQYNDLSEAGGALIEKV